MVDVFLSFSLFSEVLACAPIPQLFIGALDLLGVTQFTGAPLTISVPLSESPTQWQGKKRFPSLSPNSVGSLI